LAEPGVVEVVVEEFAYVVEAVSVDVFLVGDGVGGGVVVGGGGECGGGGWFGVGGGGGFVCLRRWIL